MKEKEFYVASVYAYSQTTIEESFTNQDDAQIYADLMARNKRRKYIVLVPVYDSQDNQAD